MTTGIWYAVLAYLFWGLVPIYWKSLQDVPSLQLICHRIAWSSVALLVPTCLSGNGSAFLRAAQSPRTLAIYAAASVTLALNWLVYVWAVNAGFIVQTALGYFINPLFSVLLGVLVLRERLRAGQWIAVGLAGLGVAYLTVYYGSLPWVALWLAFSFGVYGLLKKTAPLGPLQGLTLETSILAVPAVVYLLYVDRSGHGAFVRAGPLETALMVAAGPVTTVPLLLFAASVAQVPLSLVGMLQYLSPTLQFLIGVYLYREPFTRSQFFGFACVWAALIVFGLEAVRARRGSPRPLTGRSSPRTTSPRV
jgi:chloramphenicol-sensitive protein RarD